MALLTRHCRACHQPFTHEATRGRPPAFCSPSCRRRGTTRDHWAAANLRDLARHLARLLKQGRLTEAEARTRWALFAARVHRPGAPLPNFAAIETTPTPLGLDEFIADEWTP